MWCDFLFVHNSSGDSAEYLLKLDHKWVLEVLDESFDPPNCEL